MDCLYPRLALSLLVLVAFAASAAPSRAHDVWLTTAGGANARRVVVNYGHPHDRTPALADKVLDLLAISEGRQISLMDGLAAARVRGDFVAQSKPFVDDGHALVAARYDNGFWVKVSDKVYRNATRRMVPNAADSLWSGKFAKAVTGMGALYDKVLGHDIEIVPLGDPMAVRPGETLRVKVLFQGKPLAGGEVEYGDGVTYVEDDKIPKFKTSGEGIADIPIAVAGPVLLAVDRRVTPSAAPDQASADLYRATFWFNLGRGRGGKGKKSE
jgi:uncharacterized GH25 family protein